MFLAKKLPKNENAGNQAHGHTRQLTDNDQSRQSSNCCK